jgi:hypothetical protein
MNSKFNAEIRISIILLEETEVRSRCSDRAVGGTFRVSSPGSDKKLYFPPKFPNLLWDPPIHWIPGFFPGSKAAGA